jgi:predicted nucleic acid-binding protein
MPRADESRPVVVDASVAAQWFVNEPGSDAAADLLIDDRTLLAPEFMAIEAANVLWKKVRLGEIDRGDAAQAVDHLFDLGIRWVPSADTGGR